MAKNFSRRKFISAMSASSLSAKWAQSWKVSASGLLSLLALLNLTKHGSCLKFEVWMKVRFYNTGEEDPQIQPTTTTNILYLMLIIPATKWIMQVFTVQEQQPVLR